MAGPSVQRMTVNEAASLLGISQDAVRKRINRGSLRAVREHGQVYVLVPKQPRGAPAPAPVPEGPVQVALDVLQERVASQQERIVSLESTVERLWKLVASNEKARREEREIFRAQLVNQQLVLRQLEELKRLGTSESREESPHRHEWHHRIIYPRR